MLNKEAALHQFWNGFGIPAYEENTIPKDAKLPYITYEVITDSLSDYTTALTAQIWYKSNSWAEINEKSHAVSQALNPGARLVCSDGYILLYRGSPFAQNRVDPSDNTIKGKLININADFITT